MPTYEYACKSCGEHLEVVQSFKDDPLTTCPNCSGELRKVFGSIGIAFKGSGFYKTDSRGPAASESSASSSGSTESKPAATSTETKSPSTSPSTPPAEPKSSAASA
jgi:putative FmdB family regulatory protein